MPRPDDVDWGPPWAAAGRRPGRPPRALRVAGPLALAILQVVGSFGAAHGQHGRRALDGLAVALLLTGPTAVAFIGRFTRAMCVVVAVATALYLLLGYPYGPVFASLAVAVVVTVARGHRVAAWAVAAVLASLDALARLVFHVAPWSWASEAGVLAWLALILAVAELVRVRSERAATYREAARERRRRQAGEERLRIAQELHDVVAHHLSLINVQAGVALHLADRRPENVEPALRAIKDASKEALTELRSLIDVLRDDRPAPRAPAATLAALDDMVERSAHAGLVISKTVAGQRRPLSSAVELAAYRIVQEAVTNVVRHAQATQATVLLDYGDSVLSVIVDDNGTGPLEGAPLAEGNGLRGMSERASALGGSLETARSPLGGLRVHAVLPTGETS
jgi:signal transduction histidine kinase